MQPVITDGVDCHEDCQTGMCVSRMVVHKSEVFPLQFLVMV